MKEWISEPLSKICFMTSGGTPSRRNLEFYKDGTIPWVKSGELENNVITETDEYITEAGLDNSSAKIFPKGTLLIALYGATIGKLAFLGIDAATNQAVCGIFKNDKVDLKYLYYFLLFSRPNLVKQGQGGAQPNISQTILKKLIVPYPMDKGEQQRIVARIEELFSLLDDAKATLQKTNAQLALYRQTVLFSAFSKIDTWTNLGNISKRIFDGPFGTNLKTADYVNKGIRVVRLENIKNGWFDDSKQSYVTEDKYDTIRKHTVIPSDLIVSTFISDSIKICQLPEYIGFAVNKADCVGITLNESINPRFVMYYLASKEAYLMVLGQVHGATRPRINTKQIKQISVPICPLKQQNSIVDDIESKLSLCNGIQQTVVNCTEEINAMKQSILKKHLKENNYE